MSRFPRWARHTITAIAGLTLLGAIPTRGEEVDFTDFRAAPHRYFERTPTDRFTELKQALEDGTAPLDRSSEKAFLESLLRLLDVPVSSQMLVFSTTSLQLSRITPANPRAIYFSDDLYVGFIPGGKLEVIGLDAELGAVFHLFDLPSGAAPLRIERATRCMNCHAGEETGRVPGLLISSVVTGPNGGTLDSYRRITTGHAIPLSERFGGWYLTGIGDWTNHWGNAMGRFVEGTLVRVPLVPADRVGFAAYPRSTSALLPQLLHEHQAGFINRVVEAGYRARSYLHASGGTLSPAQQALLDEQAEVVTRYLLFADEAALPSGVDLRDPDFEREFAAPRRAVDGHSLRDLDLRTRLLANRCSYMVYSPVFRGLPPVIKGRIYARLDRALRTGDEDPASRHLPPGERGRIRSILRGTLDDLPPGW